MDTGTAYHIPFLANNSYLYGESFKAPGICKQLETRIVECTDHGTLIASIKNPIPCSVDSEFHSPGFYNTETQQSRPKPSDSFSFKVIPPTGCSVPLRKSQDTVEKNTQILYGEERNQAEIRERGEFLEENRRGEEKKKNQREGSGDQRGGERDTQSLYREDRNRWGIIENPRNLEKNTQGLYSETRNHWGASENQRDIEKTTQGICSETKNKWGVSENQRDIEKNTQSVYAESKNQWGVSENQLNTDKNSQSVYAEDKNKWGITDNQRSVESNSRSLYAEDKNRWGIIENQRASEEKVGGRYEVESKLTDTKYNSYKYQAPVEKTENESRYGVEYERKQPGNGYLYPEYNEHNSYSRGFYKNEGIYKEDTETYSCEASVLSENKPNFLSRISETQDRLHKTAIDYRNPRPQKENTENLTHLYKSPNNPHCETSESILSHQELSKYSAYSSKKAAVNRTFASLRPSQECSDKSIKPKRDIWLDQARNAKKTIIEKPMLDMSKLEKQTRSSSNNSRASKKGSNLGKSKRAVKEPRSASIHEKSFRDKEMFVSTMMKVIKDHSKYCASLRREINAIKAKNAYEI